MTININARPTNAQAGQGQSDWIAQAAANGWGNPQDLIAAIDKYNNTGTSEFDPSSDPTLARLLGQGYLSSVQTGGSDGSGQSVYGDANLPQSASGWAPAFFQQTGPSYKGPILPGGSQKDPLYGSITSNADLPQTHSLLDTIGPMVPLLFAALPAMLAGGAEAGVGGALSAQTPGLSAAQFGNSLVENAGNGGSFNPLSLLSLAQFIPGLQQLAPYLNAARGIYGATQGRNPVGGAVSLASLLRGAGGTGGG